MQLLGQQVWVGPGPCVSNELPGEARATGPQPHRGDRGTRQRRLGPRRRSVAPAREPPSSSPKCASLTWQPNAIPTALTLHQVVPGTLYSNTQLVSSLTRHVTGTNSCRTHVKLLGGLLYLRGLPPGPHELPPRAVRVTQMCRSDHTFLTIILHIYLSLRSCSSPANSDWLLVIYFNKLSGSTQCHIIFNQVIKSDRRKKQYTSRSYSQKSIKNINKK